MDHIKPELQITLREPPFLYEFLLEQITSFLPIESVLNLRLTCKYFKRMIPQWREIWFRLYAQRFYRCKVEKLAHHGPILLTCIPYFYQRKRLFQQMKTNQQIPADYQWRDVVRQKEQYPIPEEYFDEWGKTQCCTRLKHWQVSRTLPWHRYDSNVDWYLKYRDHRKEQVLEWHRKRYEDYQMTPALLLKKKKAHRMIKVYQENIDKLQRTLELYDQVLAELPAYKEAHPDPVKLKKSKQLEKKKKAERALAMVKINGHQPPAKPKAQRRTKINKRQVQRRDFQARWRLIHENRKQLAKEMPLTRIF